jgi:hypothetical protein
MNDRIRILASGKFHTGDLQFQLASISLDKCETDEIWQQAIAQGALLYEIDLNYDEYYHYPEEDEIYSFGITYGEYWAEYPEEKPVKPIPCWEARLLLTFSAPYLHLRSLHIDRYFLANSVYIPSTEDS